MDPYTSSSYKSLGLCPWQRVYHVIQESLNVQVTPYMHICVVTHCKTKINEYHFIHDVLIWIQFMSLPLWVLFCHTLHWIKQFTKYKKPFISDPLLHMLEISTYMFETVQIMSLDGMNKPIIAPPRRGFWSPFGGVCSLTYCNGNFRVTMVSEPFNVIL